MPYFLWNRNLLSRRNRHCRSESRLDHPLRCSGVETEPSSWRKAPIPRFVVTSLSPERLGARALYENFYCVRGDMENRIKEQQLDLFADRTSAGTMRANQLRLYLSSAAYMLMHALRRLGLKQTPLARAQCQTIRLKLLKIGAQVRLTVRHVWISMSEAYPYSEVFAAVIRNLQAIPLRC